MAETIKVDEFIEFALTKNCEAVEAALKGDVILIKSPIYDGLDGYVRSEIEELATDSDNRNKRQTKQINNKKHLIVFLETNGGFVEVVERISNVFRKHYAEVDFVIPNCAYSAGTVLALSGDRIYMDYYSVLGPIDPQIQNSDGKFIPGMGYLYKYNELTRKKKLTQAELLFLVKRFDPAELFVIEQAKSHSEELIRKWLQEYKFKNWTTTSDRNIPVTPQMKEKRADDIAKILADAKRWHLHGRGITIRELTGDEIKLMIDNFGEDANLNKHIRQYYDLLMDYAIKIGAKSLIHTRLGIRTLG